MKSVAIVGGGLGGLSAAIYLAKAGYDVSIFEKNAHFGGKMMPVQLGTYHFDFGPNTITMPDVFKDVLRQGGETYEHTLHFEKLESHTRNVFNDGVSFDLSSDPRRMVQQLLKIDPKGARHYPSFLKEIGRLYEQSTKHFLNRTFRSWTDYLSPSLSNAFFRVRPFQTMNEFFNLYFENPKVLQALNRYATYIGSSPYVAPATFAMIAYLELIQGVYYVRGGNTQIAKQFEELATSLGVKLYPNTQITHVPVQEGIAKGVETEDGRMIEVDRVILNGDLLHLFPKLVKEEHRPRFSNKKANSYQPSISGFVILAGVNKRFSTLAHHQLYFSSNYEKEFKQLQQGDYAEDPTIYICTSSKSDPSVSPDGDNLFILVNAPALTKDGQMMEDPERYKNRIYDILERHGLHIRSSLVEETVFTPKDLYEQFGAYRGSIYGPASERRIDAFLRPFNVSQDLSNLYFVGGSTHPGGGSPMVVLSGKNIAEVIKNEDKKA
ncbi:phytoene desaturase [Pontibacillus halophilus JSM 076056 = DSM 19796]|uniref:4,4'-diaponeurosporene oxygenase n=1 Tax=Pontibacillus halophilus JSM 076056 = DSM 19796 TaxID=1385510 RepID=A0A0A5GK54_9BACI|nr:phytoene desaturase family protein [Pontibacillus halophilus]KGX91598.1 phytoene desaturase [Pontibacillus halophilus JSM 076056 = DSM 19796]